MGLEWLNEIARILNDAGIRAGEAFPGGKWMEITGPVAAVSLRDLDYGAGLAEFEIRIISPRILGGWQCQHIAAEAVAALEREGVGCRLEPMEFRQGTDCFEMVVIGERYVLDSQEESAEAGLFEVLIGEEAVGYVTEFAAEQDRDRRLIGSLNQATPVGVTPGMGGWAIKMVQVLPRGADAAAEPEEPFTLTVKEDGLTTVFSGCCWNRLKKQMDQSQIKAEWEGFALTREERTDG